MSDGDRAERFDRMYRDHYAAVVAYGRRRGAGSPEDIAAEIFTVAWRKLEAVPTDALPWLFVTARNLLANERRKQARRRKLFAPSPGIENGSGDLDLGAALAALSASDREVLMLAAWENLSGERLAAAIGCSVGTARVRLHRARRRLAQALDRTLAPDDDRLPIFNSKDVP